MVNSHRLDLENVNVSLTYLLSQSPWDGESIQNRHDLSRCAPDQSQLGPMYVLIKDTQPRLGISRIIQA